VVEAFFVDLWLGACRRHWARYQKRRGLPKRGDSAESASL